MPYKIIAPTPFTGTRSGEDATRWVDGITYLPDDDADGREDFTNADGYTVDQVDEIPTRWRRDLAIVTARGHNYGQHPDQAATPAADTEGA